MNAVDAAHMAYLVRWAAGRGTRLVARGGTRLRAPVATYSTFTAGAGRSRRFVASTYETALLLCSAPAFSSGREMSIRPVAPTFTGCGPGGRRMHQKRPQERLCDRETRPGCAACLCHGKFLCACHCKKVLLVL